MPILLAVAETGFENCPSSFEAVPGFAKFIGIPISAASPGPAAALARRAGSHAPAMVQSFDSRELRDLVEISTASSALTYSACPSASDTFPDSAAYAIRDALGSYGTGNATSSTVATAATANTAATSAP